MYVIIILPVLLNNCTKRT